MTRIKTLTAVALAVFACSATADADGLYDSRSAYLSALAGYSTHSTSFEDLIGTTFPDTIPGGGFATTDPDGVTVDGVRYVGYTHFFGNETFMMGPGVESGIYSFNGTTCLMGGRASLTITPPPGTTAFGFDLGRNLQFDNSFGTNSDIVVHIMVEYTAGSMSFWTGPISPNTTSFYGYVSSWRSISRITITGPQSTSSVYPLTPYPMIDNVTFANGPAQRSWSGVLQPINSDGTSVFKAGAVIPVRFALTGSDAGKTDLIATLSYSAIANDGSVGPINEASSTGAATSGNLFRYDPESDQYVFNWGTKLLNPGKYRLTIDFGGDDTHDVVIGLR